MSVSHGNQLRSQPHVGRGSARTFQPNHKFIRYVMPLAFFLASCSSATELTGNELAREIIALSLNGTKSVSMSNLADGACIVPEQLYAPYYARQFFPGFKLKHVESDASEGVWFLLVPSKQEKEVAIYAIHQNVLFWNVPDDAIASRLVSCPMSLSIRISPSTPTPELVVTQEEATP